MTVTSPTQTTTPAQAGVTAPAEGPRRRRTIVIGAIVLVAAGAAVGGFALRGNGGGRGASDNADPTSVTEVAQGTLVSQTEVEATLGYTGSYSIVNAAQGTLTWLPSIGQIVTQGQTLYDVNATPVVLLYGATPAYRTLSEGATDGADVEQLNADLVALGYVSAADLDPSSDVFSYGTKVGVEKLQKALGETENGTLTLGQFLFESTAVRVTGLGTNTVLGGAAQPGTPILTGTSTGRVVTIDLDANDEGDVAVGDPVTITLPDNSTTPGKVSSVGTVASTSDDDSPGGSSDPTITVLVTPTDSAATGNLDQAPVEVTITTDSDKDTLYVPADALLALSGGGYGIETIAAKGVHTIVPVSLGLFDDNAGTVAIAGSSLQVGQRIVIPASS